MNELTIPPFDKMTQDSIIAEALLLGFNVRETSMGKRIGNDNVNIDCDKWINAANNALYNLSIKVNGMCKDLT
mgnify:CR=1 FL=1